MVRRRGDVVVNLAAGGGGSGRGKAEAELPMAVPSSPCPLSLSSTLWRSAGGEHGRQTFDVDVGNGARDGRCQDGGRMLGGRTLKTGLRELA